MANSIISPDRFNKLKAKVKAECQRRAYVGPVNSYSGSDYDYINVPAINTVITKEHYEKIAIPMNAISGDIPVNGARVIDGVEMTTMETKVTTLSNISLGASQANTGCAASCTGLCSTGCYNECTGCTSCTSCSGCYGCGGCDGTCSGRCSGTCSGSCTGGCSACGGCDVNCSGSCWSTSAGGGSCTGAYCTAMCCSSSTA